MWIKTKSEIYNADYLVSIWAEDVCDSAGNVTFCKTRACDCTGGFITLNNIKDVTSIIEAAIKRGDNFVEVI